VTALVAGLAFIAEESRRLTATRVATGATLVAGLAFVTELAGWLVGNRGGRCNGKGQGT
jgi:hypothetical protein